MAYNSLLKPVARQLDLGQLCHSRDRLGAPAAPPQQLTEGINKRRKKIIKEREKYEQINAILQAMYVNTSITVYYIALQL